MNRDLFIQAYLYQIKITWQLNFNKKNIVYLVIDYFEVFIGIKNYAKHNRIRKVKIGIKEHLYYYPVIVSTWGTDSKQILNSTSQSLIFFTWFSSLLSCCWILKNSSWSYWLPLSTNHTLFIRLKYNWKWWARDLKLFVSRITP